MLTLFDFHFAAKCIHLSLLFSLKKSLLDITSLTF